MNRIEPARCRPTRTHRHAVIWRTCQTRRADGSAAMSGTRVPQAMRRPVVDRAHQMAPWPGPCLAHEAYGDPPVDCCGRVRDEGAIASRETTARESRSDSVAGVRAGSPGPNHETQYTLAMVHWVPCPVSVPGPSGRIRAAPNARSSWDAPNCGRRPVARIRPPRRSPSATRSCGSSRLVMRADDGQRSLAWPYRSMATGVLIGRALQRTEAGTDPGVQVTPSPLRRADELEPRRPRPLGPGRLRPLRSSRSFACSPSAHGMSTRTRGRDQSLDQHAARPCAQPHNDDARSVMDRASNAYGWGIATAGPEGRSVAEGHSAKTIIGSLGLAVLGVGAHAAQARPRGVPRPRGPGR